MTSKTLLLSPDAIHAILTAEAARVQLPKFYIRDLTFHDLNDLHESGTKHFVYVLRECGTHIVRLDQGREQYACVTAIAGMANPESMHWYEFRNSELREISMEDAKRLASQSVPARKTSKPRNCQCSDPGCPIHHTHSDCTHPATTTLYRIDMQDETGTPMCEGCAEDAFESGVFTDEPSN
jgi:hypothetical protein